MLVALAERAMERRGLYGGTLRGRAFDLVASVLYRLDYWLGLPWTCRLRGHRRVAEREYWNGDACAVEERWLECVACGSFLGHAADDPLRGVPA